MHLHRALLRHSICRGVVTGLYNSIEYHAFIKTNLCYVQDPLFITSINPRQRRLNFVINNRIYSLPDRIDCLFGLPNCLKFLDLSEI